MAKTQEKKVKLIKNDFSFINQGCKQKIKDNGSSAQQKIKKMTSHLNYPDL